MSILAGCMALALQGQNSCGITVDAGDPVSICTGGSAMLQGMVTGGNGTEHEWSPAAGLSDPTILNPTASPAVTTTYTLTATAMSDNLVTNGDFETGDILPATSQYTMVSDPVDIALNAPNFYGILSVPQIVQAFGCTPPIGLYTMVIHGSTGVNVNFWCETIPVVPNTDYKFTYTVYGILYFFAPAPEIVLKVNGTEVGSITAPNSLCGSVTKTWTWNSGAATSADVCFANATVAGLGSMCAIDDIIMKECCVESDTVTVTVIPEIEVLVDTLICEGSSLDIGGQTFDQEGNYEVVLTSYQGCDSTVQLQLQFMEVDAYIAPPAKLNCLIDQVSLDGSGSSSPFGISSYSWSTLDGQILSDPGVAMINVGAPGTYTLVVTSTNGAITCTDQEDILVEIDTIAPSFSFQDPPMPPCDNPVVTLAANGIQMPPNAQISWSTWNGQILSGGNSMTPTVSGSGTYTLLVADPGNGCFTLDSIQVQADTSKPVIQLLEVPHLDCRDSLGWVVAGVVSPPSGFTVVWTTSNGLILGDPDSLAIEVNQAGQYTLTVTDDQSGCTSGLDVSVESFTMPPTPVITVPDTLDCLTPWVALSAGLPAEVDSFMVHWSTGSGMIGGSADSLMIQGGAAGTYTVLVENLATGCRDSASMVVLANLQPPVVSAGPDLTIDCLQSSVVPQSTGSSSGTGFAIEWTRNGQGFPGDTLLQPLLTGSGTYILQITNLSNGCADQDTLAVSAATGLPTLQILPPDTLDCVTPVVMLDAGNSSQGQHLIQWTGPPGGIQSGPSGLMPVVALPGWYILSILDTTSQCLAMDSVKVVQLLSQPVIVLANPDTLDCQTPVVVLSAMVSGSSGNPVFQWSTLNGQILTGGNSGSPTVSTGGLYTLIVTDPATGCTATSSVSVVQDPDLPGIAVSAPDTLTCIRTEVDLTATVQASNPNVIIAWSTSDGSIISGGDSLTAVVNAPGTYTFSLTDPSTGCMASVDVEVMENTLLPTVNISPPDTLDCLTGQVQLLAIPVNFPGTLDLLWTTTDGLISGSPTTNPLVTASAGTYLLTWTVPGNGCTDSVSQVVQENKVPPVADAGSDALIPCNGQNLALDGSASAGQGNLAFQWMTTNGLIQSGDQTGMPQIGLPGIYILTVTDGLNGCQASDTVVIQASTGLSASFDLVLPVCGSPGTITLVPSGGQPAATMSISGIPGSFGPGQPVSLVAGIWPVSVSDGSGCPFDTVITMPTANDLFLSAPGLVLLTPGSTAQIQLTINLPSSQIAQVSWSPASGIGATSDPLSWTVSASSSTTYQVIVTTFDGCSGTATIQVDLVSDPPALFVPNAFSPGDINGINDLFFPMSRPGTITSIRNMAIYDRWGTNLFLRSDFPPDDANYGWDGSFRGRALDPGVYIWVIEVVLSNGETRLYKGDVTLF